MLRTHTTIAPTVAEDDEQVAAGDAGPPSPTVRSVRAPRLAGLRPAIAVSAFTPFVPRTLRCFWHQQARSASALP